ncbi:BTAD domain-containing putative transcriptional regulator [Pseudonocardia charpentierae]|uniref:BTAD domain-containing putative transcriptional regulator n=1 Tax=Pseudonocardia charpentierae TaxID=3075545 RepID=A0ABU2N213_9PSEU|nr:BTAD domain-containing putative transcriptional regulator [Pseudonocardia sp. DSM 45834]MDT0347943.1 BTAD domain-containing putative transcriptional regulator [Pseudonocardia sp. DSM 45834]
MDDPGSTLRVEVLGPLRVVVGGLPVEVPGPKRRAVLALLALAEGRTVRVDRLVDALWPGDVQESGRQALHTHISRLRTHLGPAAARVQTRHGGYRLDLAADGLDLAQARTLLARARETPDLAVLKDAHALWRGPALADLTDVEPIAVAVEGCAQLYREVTDALIACAVGAGRAGDVVGLATAAHADDPLREPAVLLLMRVLAATGQAPEALRTGREYRRRLADETGLDPSPALGELERDVASGSGKGGPAPVEHTRPTTRLFGREAQVATLHRLIGSERLVTVVGAGGVGKTRVALEVAQRCEASTVLLLAPVTDPAAIPHALAAALNLQVAQGDVLAACIALLGDRPGLLVVDNCEHLVDAARDTVGVLLSACPGLVVLATSREPLGLAAEYAFRLAPLALPDSDRDLAEVPSVAVFLDRARRVRPDAAPTPADLHLVADVVRRLDGMPLAIELAAGRLSGFSLTDLHRRLDRALDLLGGRTGGNGRHRTLRATVEWSYELLSDDERRLFRYLSVFVDGVALDDAERLAADLIPDTDPGAVLARLVDASMIDAAFAEGGTRYRILETLRAFGLDRLTAEHEDDDAGDRLLRWAVDLTTWFASTVATEREPEADAVLRRELANLRAAWQSTRSRGAIDDGAVLVASLHDAVTYRDLIEIRGWAEELAADFIGDPALAAHPRAAAVLGTAAEAAYHRGDHATAEGLARGGLDRATDKFGTWCCLSVLSVVALARGAHAEVVEHSLAADAIAPRPRDNPGVAALAMAYSGELDRARELQARGRSGAVSPSMRAWNHYVAGEIESVAGDTGAAERHYLQAIDLARTSGATFLGGVALVGLVALRGRAGRTADALRGYRDVVDYFARTGNWTHLWPALRNLADLLRRLGDPDDAAVLDSAADASSDAPAVDRAVRPPAAPAVSISRAEVLRVARDAIERNLSR